MSASVQNSQYTDGQISNWKFCLVARLASDKFAMTLIVKQAVKLKWQHVFQMTYESSKLGQNDLVFDVWSEFFSRSVLAGLVSE